MHAGCCCLLLHVDTLMIVIHENEEGGGILVLTTGESSGCEEGGNGKGRSSQQSEANHNQDCLMIGKKNENVGEDVKEMKRLKRCFLCPWTHPHYNDRVSLPSFFPFAIYSMDLQVV